MSIKIGHAIADENGKKTGGNPGNQSGKELTIQDFYDSEWLYVFRAKSTIKAKTLSLAMRKACNNRHIGYNQSRRTTLFEQAKKFCWNIENITVNCDCDCSALVAVCLNVAGIEISKDMWTGNELELIQRTGFFNTYKYAKGIKLFEGDILLKKGHTCIVVGVDEPGIAYYPIYTGNSVSIVDALYIVGEKDTSLTHRKRIAVANNLCKAESDWKGTAEQNTRMLNMLKQGKLVKS